MRTAFDQALAQSGIPPPMACVEGDSSMRMQLLRAERNYLSILAASEVQLYGLVEEIGWLSLEPVIASADIESRANRLS